MADSDHLGITLCQACFYLMGARPADVVRDLGDKVFFIHFRNVTGTPARFTETFHDDGSIDMAEAVKIYSSLPEDVPVRVDHVPLMAGEQGGPKGYTALGRLFADGYLKGLIEGVKA
jgi:mannonate dehydratase